MNVGGKLMTSFMDGPQEANSGATNDLGVNIVD